MRLRRLLVALTVTAASAACTEVESPSEIDEGPTRQDVVEETDSDVAPSP